MTCIAERKKKKSDLTHEELIHCMYQMLDSTCWLHRNESSVDDLRPMYIGRRKESHNWMLLDRLFDPTPANVSQLSNYVHNKDLYMSPLLWAGVFQGKKVKKNVHKDGIKHDPKKSDLFALGMCILEAGVLSSVQDVYNKKDGTITCENLDKHLHHFGEKYGAVNGLLCDILNHCLIIDEFERPSCCQLLNDITPYAEVCHFLEGGHEVVVHEEIVHPVVHHDHHQEVNVERARPHHDDHRASPARHRYEGHVESQIIHGEAKHHHEVIRKDPKIITEVAECVVTHSGQKLKPEIHVETLEPRHERSQVEGHEPVHREPIHHAVEKHHHDPHVSDVRHLDVHHSTSVPPRRRSTVQITRAEPSHHHHEERRVETIVRAEPSHHHHEERRVEKIVRAEPSHHHHEEPRRSSVSRRVSRVVHREPSHHHVEPSHRLHVEQPVVSKRVSHVHHHAEPTVIRRVSHVHHEPTGHRVETKTSNIHEGEKSLVHHYGEKAETTRNTETTRHTEGERSTVKHHEGMTPTKHTMDVHSTVHHHGGHTEPHVEKRTSTQVHDSGNSIVHHHGGHTQTRVENRTSTQVHEGSNSTVHNHGGAHTDRRVEHVTSAHHPSQVTTTTHNGGHTEVRRSSIHNGGHTEVHRSSVPRRTTTTLAHHHEPATTHQRTHEVIETTNHNEHHFDHQPKVTQSTTVHRHPAEHTTETVTSSHMHVGGQGHGHRDSDVNREKLVSDLDCLVQEERVKEHLLDVEA
jgi:hypothetical protein